MENEKREEVVLEAERGRSPNGASSTCGAAPVVTPSIAEDPSDFAAAATALEEEQAADLDDPTSDTSVSPEETAPQAPLDDPPAPEPEHEEQVCSVPRLGGYGHRKSGPRVLSKKKEPLRQYDAAAAVVDSRHLAAEWPSSRGLLHAGRCEQAYVVCLEAGFRRAGACGIDGQASWRAPDRETTRINQAHHTNA